MKAVEIYLAAGQEFLQEVDPALLEVLRDRGFGLAGSPSSATPADYLRMLVLTSEQAPAPGPEAHLQIAIARTRSRYDPRDCYRNLRPTARVSAELPLALVEEIDQARGNVSCGRYLQMVINAAMTREQPPSEDGQN